MCIWTAFFNDTYLNTHYRHFLSIYFLLFLSSCGIDVMISGENWLINLIHNKNYKLFSKDFRSNLRPSSRGNVLQSDVTFACT